jgi:hypothetical protein
MSEAFAVARACCGVIGPAILYLTYMPRIAWREATYRSALQAYSQKLRLGTTRKEVENYLRAAGASFIDEGDAHADLVKVGREDTPWYCDEHDVYVAFEFVPTEPHPLLRAYDTDALKVIRISRQQMGCL